MDRKTPWLAYLLAVANATIIGLSFMFTKIAVVIEIEPGQKVPPMDTLFFRFGLALVALLLYLKWAGIPVVRRGLGIVHGWLPLLPIVLFYPLGYFIFQAYGLMTVPSSEAGILTASTPAITTILAALLLGEKTNFKQFGCILLSMAGVVGIALCQGTRINGGNGLGIGLILASCFVSACYTIYNRVLIRKYTPWEITFVMMFFGTLCFSGISLFTHLRNSDLPALFRPLGHLRYLLPVLYLGIFASLVTTLLASFILKRISSAQLVVFFNLSTVVSILAGFFFLNESIHFYHFAGTTVIIAGVIGTNYFKTPEKALKNDAQEI